MDYMPQVSTGYYPEDAGWASRPDGENLLLLSIPDLRFLLTFQVNSYDYAWLYDQELEAYIFCFKINNKSESAVIFQRDHAGILLQEEFALKPFTVVITEKDFEHLSENDPVFQLDNIEMVKSDTAGW